MLGKQYVVRQGDTLWDLSNKFLGDPLKWPELFEHNNQNNVISNTGTRINDPDLIFIGQKIYIPTGKQATAPKPKRKLQTKPNMAKKKAKRRAYSIPFKYELNTVPDQVVASPAYIATISLKGSITVQPSKAVDFMIMKSTGFELTAKREADKVLGSLLSEVKLEFNPALGEINYEVGFTAHSTIPYAPSGKVSASISSQTGLPVIKSSIIAPDIKGSINGYIYVTNGLEIEIELTPNNKQSEAGRVDEVPAQSPAQQTVPENNFWDKLVGVSHILGAGIIIVATIAEDIVTAGAGIADDPASFAAASLLLYRGLALMKTVRTGAAIRIKPAVVFAH
ncbi:MAG TPA: LysM domain-containing protein [Gammaproteobacteria bacterium]|nr:LysM domain-containing protein [Gammaproteobacteria bacterium]